MHEFVAEDIVIHNSSTHQYPDGTMTEILARARQKEWPVFRWCWRESANETDGWLSHAMVERKKGELTEQMFAIEYDLQEPSHEGRAIDGAAVDEMFDPDLGVYEGKRGEHIIIEPPMEGVPYITGVDWAKEQDDTVITTWRVDGRDWYMVAFERTNRESWPAMVAKVELRLERYGGVLVHDSTGIGNVVEDLLKYDKNKTRGIGLRGRDREVIFTEYIGGIEQKALKAPRIMSMYDEHRYLTQKKLWGTGSRDHTPDSFVSAALAWSQRKRVSHEPVGPGIILRTEPSEFKMGTDSRTLLP